MNVLLLGNGFDIYHYLPTKYHNFLSTVNHLIYNYTGKENNVGSILGNKELQSEDPFIADCYLWNKNVFNTTFLPQEKMWKMIELCRDNLWFSYFANSFNADVGWIDFEREVAFVTSAMKEFLLDSSNRMFASDIPRAHYHILKHFDFFMTINTTGGSGIFDIRIFDEYILEYPKGSGNEIINKEKIISRLLNMLDDVAEALKIFLECFVDAVLQNSDTKCGINKCQAIANIDYTISFNYTSTYEKLYFDNTIYHLHGSLEDKIIIGINPDTDDNKATIDTSFVGFKKYYQRTLFETDREYIKWINGLNDTHDEYCLTVMGHSLDVTDADIITELFQYASEINILYHNEDAKRAYITNLVKIFGKEGVDDLKLNKRLAFYHLDEDFTDFTEHLKSNSEEMYLNMINCLN